MARSLLAAFALFSAMTAPAFADDDVPAEVAAVALQAGVDPVDLAGAVNTTGLSASDYLCATGEGKCPAPASASAASTSGYRAYVRLTYYVYNSGSTANGERVHIGGTACSTNFRFGQRFVLPDGSIVTCNDRGILGSSGWLDVFGRRDIGAMDWGWVTVLN